MNGSGRRCKHCQGVLLAFMLWFTGLAFAHGGTVTLGSKDVYPLSSDFTVLANADRKLTFEDILTPTLQAQFKPVAAGPSPTHFGTTNAAIWLRVNLLPEATAIGPWLLEIAHPALDQIQVFVLKEDGSYSQQSAGDHLPFSAKKVQHRNHVLEIPLVPGRPSTLFLRVQSFGMVLVPVKLWQEKALWQDDQKSYAMFSLYFGLLLGLILYNALLYTSVRDHAYLLYVGFACFIGLGQLASSGIGAQFLWPHSVWWANNSLNITFSCSGAVGVAFARSFLATRIHLPRFDRVLQASIALYILTLLISLTLPYSISVLMVKVSSITAMACIVTLIGLGLYHRHSGAQYFAWAWGALIFSMFILVLHNFGLIPSNTLTANPVLVGSALEMLLLSFALANRINIVKRDKEQAEAQVRMEQSTVSALNQSQERYRSVIEHVAEGMLVLQNERIVFSNFRATEILEVTKAEILASTIVERIYPPDRLILANFIRDHLQTEIGSSAVCQARLELPSQAIKWLEFGSNIVPWDDGQGLLLYFLDVTERHHAELETQAAINRQQELIELRARFVAMTSHEFRTPLAAIQSAQELLKTFDDRLPPAQKAELLGIIESAVARMTRMSERVLLLGRIEANMLEFEPHALDIKSLCEGFVADAIQQNRQSPCQIVAECSPVLVAGLYDEKLLQHIFSNLLSNALKYSPAGGTVRLKVYPSSEGTVFEVSDQGIGVPEADLANLFESFHRASNVGAIQGTGLGLAIVKQAVDLHGGTIRVRSALGEGTCFTVLLG